MSQIRDMLSRNAYTVSPAARLRRLIRTPRITRMGYPDLEKAREYHAALREIFIHHAGGWADKDALHKVEKLAWQAMTLVKDTECQEKMGIVEHYAASLYSESEHHKWRMRSLPGADFLRLQILRALVAFHSRLFAIEAARRNGLDPDFPPAHAFAPHLDAERPD